jgi:3',5'-cyclic AMP phosphodiesterase CpdA
MPDNSIAGEEIHYLFRFRDLIAPTIKEHARVINDKGGACWWGWWKRPTEDARLDVWLPLEKEAKTHPVRVGLFDSGTGNVFAAWTSEVIKPQEDPNSPVPVPPGQEHLIPEYYSKSPFSRAWMKLVKIEDSPIEFFGKYSLAKVPPLPNYSPAILNRLLNKIIKTRDELRGMDTTIWQVRAAHQNDHDEEIILTTRSLSSPLSTESVDLQSNTILHISDPHFSTKKHREKHIWRLESELEGHQGRPTLAEAVNLGINKKPIGLLIITGDLTFTGEEDEFAEAVTSITRLLGLLNLDKDRVIIVPGNHDICWTKSESYDEKAPVTEAPEQAKKNYEGFYRRLFGHMPNANLSMGRRFQLPCGVALEICGLNSSSLETGAKFLAGMGRIEEKAFAEVANELHWDKPSLALRVVALHHHLTLTEDLEPVGGYYQGFGIAVDAPRILRMAAKYGVHLALHGHKHRAFIWRSGVYNLPEYANDEWQLGTVSIIGGATAGSIDREGGKNYFNLIDVSSDGIKLNIYRAMNSGAFGEMSNWKADFTLTSPPNRLALGDWTK